MLAQCVAFRGRYPSEPRRAVQGNRVAASFENSTVCRARCEHRERVFDMGDDKFFEEAKEQSVVKASITAKYFWAWAKVVMPTAKQSGGKVAYIDLFAGPGRYKDGTKSTPLLVLERAIADPQMKEMLVALFNDADSNNCRSLEQAIGALPGIDTLRHPPRVYNYEVSTEVVKMFEQVKLVPTLLFVDPWGYKGLSLRLVNSVLKNWGCDCIFFFNYNRINMGLPNKLVDSHMSALFGEERANNLRQRLAVIGSTERELTIVEALVNALREMGGKYVLPFRFRSAVGTRTSHHLIFVSKHFRGYEIMKEIMARESSESADGVASFEYSPASARQPLLFKLSLPLDDLKASLLSAFAGKTRTMKEIYEQHNVDTPYTKANYKRVLAEMELEGSVVVVPPVEARRRNTFADTVEVTFPRRVE